MKKIVLSIVFGFAIATFATAQIVSTPTNTVEVVEKGDCDKCGKDDCKGCESKKEGEKTAEAKGKKACAKGEGKSCCGSAKKAESKKVEEAKK